MPAGFPRSSPPGRTRVSRDDGSPSGTRSGRWLWTLRGLDCVLAGDGVCRAWLRQALLGRTFPEETEPGDFIVAGERRITVGGRLFTTLEAAARPSIQGYLVAAAAGDPDLAVRFLLRELRPLGRADRAGFTRRMRHAWSIDADAAGGSELMAQLLLHWRLAVEHGYEPSAGLTSFYRGALSAVRAAVWVGAEGDALLNALTALQIRLIVSRVEAWTGVSSGAVRSAREAGWRMVTTLASAPLGPDGEPVAGGRLLLFGSWLLVLTAIGLVMPALVASGAAWADQVGAALFAVVGGLLLYGATRTGPTP